MTFLFYSSLAAIQAQVRKELEAEKAAASAVDAAKVSEIGQCVKEQSSDDHLPLALAVQGVYFRCPLISKFFL